MNKNEKVINREKSLYKNTGIIAIGTLCSKAFQFFLLPLYTNVLSTEDYGIVDVLLTVTTLIIPIITLQLSSSAFRYLIDVEDKLKRAEIISTAFLTEIVLSLFATKDNTF